MSIEVLQYSYPYLRQEYSARSTRKKLTAIIETCSFIVSPSTLVLLLCFQLLESDVFKIIFPNIWIYVLVCVYVCFPILVEKAMKICCISWSLRSEKVKRNSNVVFLTWLFLLEIAPDYCFRPFFCPVNIQGWKYLGCVLFPITSVPYTAICHTGFWSRAI